jgi:hypothetical protein
MTRARCCVQVLYANALSGHIKVQHRNARNMAFVMAMIMYKIITRPKPMPSGCVKQSLLMMIACTNCQAKPCVQDGTTHLAFGGSGRYYSRVPGLWSSGPQRTICWVSVISTRRSDPGKITRGVAS